MKLESFMFTIAYYIFINLFYQLWHQIWSVVTN